MQTATEPNNAFSAPSSLGHSTDPQASSSNAQHSALASVTIGEITDDEELPPAAPLRRESSSEGVRYILFVVRFYSYL